MGIFWMVQCGRCRESSGLLCHPTRMNLNSVMESNQLRMVIVNPGGGRLYVRHQPGNFCSLPLQSSELSQPAADTSLRAKVEATEQDGGITLMTATQLRRWFTVSLGVTGGYVESTDGIRSSIRLGACRVNVAAFGDAMRLMGSGRRMRRARSAQQPRSFDIATNDPCLLRRQHSKIEL